MWQRLTNEIISSCSLLSQGSRGGSAAENLSNFVRNVQTSSCFYQSCSHGLIHSSHQAFHYAELWRDQSKYGFHLAASVMQNSWILGRLNYADWIYNLTFFLSFHNASALFLRSSRNLELISFLLVPKVSAKNDLSAVEYTKTDRVTLKECVEMRFVNYFRSSQT